MKPRPCLFPVDPAGTGHVDNHAGAFEATKHRIRADVYTRLSFAAARGWEARRIMSPTVNTVIVRLGLVGVFALEDL